MDSIQLNLGTIGDQVEIDITWLDDNCVPRKETLQIKILDRDKPRILRVARIDKSGVYTGLFDSEG